MLSLADMDVRKPSSKLASFEMCLVAWISASQISFHITL